MPDGEVLVVPAAEAGFAAVETVMMCGASSRNCWCQFHVLSNAEQAGTTRQDRRLLLSEQVATLDPPRGLIAFKDREPVGWCGVEPRPRLRHVLSTRLVARNSLFPLDDPNVWTVYCIIVMPSLRRQGLGRLLLSTAIGHAAAHGARAIEGLPIDTAPRGGKLPDGFSTGTLDMFETEGFTTLTSLPSGRTLVYKVL